MDQWIHWEGQEDTFSPTTYMAVLRQSPHPSAESTAPASLENRRGLGFCIAQGPGHLYPPRSHSQLSSCLCSGPASVSPLRLLINEFALTFFGKNLQYILHFSH